MHKYLQQFDAVIFDMDGTLIDSMPTHMESWRQTGEIHGFPYDAEWHYSLGGVPSLETVALINQRYDLALEPKAVAKTKREAWEAMAQEPVLFAETLAVFQQLSGKKPIAVGTGSARAHAQEVLTQVGLLDQLSALVTSCDVKQGKPHPETFAKAAEQMSIVPERCLVFEDTGIGRQAALAAGMACVLVLEGRIQWPESLG